MKQIPSVAHESAVDVIIARYPGSRRRGFMAAVRELVENMRDLDAADPVVDMEVADGDDDGDLESYGDPDEELMFRQVIPDAYLIDGDAITVFEVEVTNPVAKKMPLYASLWFDLDCEGIDLRLIHVDQFGRETELVPAATWYQALEETGRTL